MSTDTQLTGAWSGARVSPGSHRSHGHDLRSSRQDRVGDAHTLDFSCHICVLFASTEGEVLLLLCVCDWQAVRTATSHSQSESLSECAWEYFQPLRSTPRCPHRLCAPVCRLLLFVTGRCRPCQHTVLSTSLLQLQLSVARTIAIRAAILGFRCP